ncbi:hypothetical protein XF_2284 [Xylella fastidiosa 9a5c]|uniref:Uncharacterized protein n=1 Tax=Xylella fastidiosa (strain 9a5c) TaxID=160492 RepID=Q9PB60_XYLFA|nr:hypothetical protein XF_2284 [Xylella fastidiosa 9a5c]
MLLSLYHCTVGIFFRPDAVSVLTPGCKQAGATLLTLRVRATLYCSTHIPNNQSLFRSLTPERITIGLRPMFVLYRCMT